MIQWHAWKQGLAAATFGALAAAGPALADPVLSLNINPNPAAVGGTVSVDVVISGALDLYAYQFSLSFDPSVLQATGSTEGAFLPTGGTTFFSPGSFDNTLGVYSFTVGTLIGALPGVNGAGTLATLSFDVAAAGVSSLTLSDVVLLDSALAEIPAQLQGGVVTAVPEPGTWLMFGLGLAGVAGLARRRDAAHA